jgi:hypothetical protein
LLDLFERELRVLHQPRRGPTFLSPVSQLVWREQGLIEQGGLEGRQSREDFRPGDSALERFAWTFFSLTDRMIPPRLPKPFREEWRRIDHNRVVILRTYMCPLCTFPQMTVTRPC